ncbi:MAG: GNAT family N-acetyltransferase [Planctomycetes bacterium]|nr:GNAT family N-acetyltransferase [Planctomycetota bacterium]
MKLLLDTNVFIPLEPAAAADLEPTSAIAARVWQLAHAGGHTAFLHPATKHDLARDKDTGRAELRGVLLAKYAELPDPPSIPSRLKAVIGEAPHGSNDWVDDSLLAALEADAVDFVISQDKGVRAKARRLGIDDRVLTLDEALRVLGGRPPVVAPPAVKAIKAHALPSDDPILESFRQDYPGFDKWFSKCRREHRQAWKIDGAGRLAAFCIVKDEEEDGLGLGAKPMKICSFKVAPEFNGFKYGELLLKTLFEHAYSNGNTSMFVTVFERHSGLLELLEDFGFERKDHRTKLGEVVLVKQLSPRPGVFGLPYHVAFGPPRFDRNNPWFIVPIQPRYSDVLFPETAEAKSLFEGQYAFGNAIRKAYLCHSACRQLSSGDVLAFYRTRVRQGLIAIGVVEDALVSEDPATVLRAVARRTVYSTREVEDLCRRPVLAIRFRQTMLVKPSRSADELVKANVFSRAPQSIMRTGKEGTQWLIDQFAA